MTPLRRKMLADFQLRNLAVGTIRAYIRSVAAFARFHGRSPADLDEKDVRAFLLDLEARGRAPATRIVYWAALRFVYVETLGRPEVFATIPRPRLGAAAAPVSLTKTQARALLDASSESPFDYTFFATMLATGMRISEVCQLTIDDVDAASGLLSVRFGKGGKARVVMLSGKHLRLLRRFWSKERPLRPWLFPARRMIAPGIIDPEQRWADHPVGAGTMGRRFRKIVSRSGLKRRVTSHDLRRTFATWMIEADVDLRAVQVLLGHASPLTTARYIAINADLVRSLPSGLDLM